MATAKELRELSLDDLGRRAVEIREGLFQDQLKMKTGALDNPSARTMKKRDLARVMQVMGEKQRAAQQTSTEKSEEKKA
jgi:large subunit ribosomal protein L29